MNISVHYVPILARRLNRPTRLDVIQPLIDRCARAPPLATPRTHVAIRAPLFGSHVHVRGDCFIIRTVRIWLSFHDAAVASVRYREAPHDPSGAFFSLYVTVFSPESRLSGL